MNCGVEFLKESALVLVWRFLVQGLCTVGQGVPLLCPAYGAATLLSIPLGSHTDPFQN